MGNTLYADSLIGMTIPEAEKFIRENIIYIDADNTAYRISKISVSNNDICTADYCLNRLNVEVEQNVISKILNIG